jgi:hypothetical protein
MPLGCRAVGCRNSSAACFSSCAALARQQGFGLGEPLWRQRCMHQTFACMHHATPDRIPFACKHLTRHTAWELLQSSEAAAIAASSSQRQRRYPPNGYTVHEQLQCKSCCLPAEVATRAEWGRCSMCHVSRVGKVQHVPRQRTSMAHTLPCQCPLWSCRTCDASWRPPLSVSECSSSAHLMAQDPTSLQLQEVFHHSSSTMQWTHCAVKLRLHECCSARVELVGQCI